MKSEDIFLNNIVGRSLNFFENLRYWSWSKAPNQSVLLCPFFCSGSLKIWYVCSLAISCSLKSAINYNFNTLKSLVKKSRTNYFLPRLAPLLMMNFFGQLPSIILTQYDIFEFRDDWIYLLLYPLISIFRREFCSPVAASVEFLMHCVLYQMVWVSIY